MSIEPSHTALRSRPDAVDLVIEDHHASETVVARERQHPGLESYNARRPVVSRGLEGANVRGETKSGLVQSTAHWVAEETGPVAGVAVETVVGLETLPPAQLEIVNAMSLYDDVENDENPWT
jgi:hypothetical protein